MKWQRTRATAVLRADHPRRARDRAPLPQWQDVLTIPQGLRANGLAREARSRFSTRFRLATSTQRTAIYHDVCYPPKAKPEHQFAAQFFDTIRDQTATAFYTTPQGWKDLGYIGNVAIPKFEGPNAEIRRKIGLE